MYKPLNQVYSESVDKTKIPLPWEKITESIGPNVARVRLYAEDPVTKEKDDLGDLDSEFYHKELIPYIKRGHPESIGMVRTIQSRLANLNAGSKDNIDEYYHFCKDVGIDLKKENSDKFASIIWGLTNNNDHTTLSKILADSYGVLEETILKSERFIPVLMAMPVNKGEAGAATGKGEVFLSFFGGGNKPVGSREEKGDVMIGSAIYEVKKARPDIETAGANLLDHAATTYTTETFKRDMGNVYNKYVNAEDKTQAKIQAVNELTTMALNCAGGANGVDGYGVNALEHEVRPIISANLDKYFKESNVITLKQFMLKNNMKSMSNSKTREKARELAYQQGVEFKERGELRMSKSLERLIGCINLKAYYNLKHFNGIIVFTDTVSKKTPVSFLLTKDQSISNLIVGSEKAGITFNCNLNKRGHGGLAVFIGMSNSLKW